MSMAGGVIDGPNGYQGRGLSAGLCSAWKAVWAPIVGYPIKSLGQITQAIRAEAEALGIEVPWVRVRITTGEAETQPGLRMSWSDIAMASLFPALLIAAAVAMSIKS
jgi:hypothetical protein